MSRGAIHFPSKKPIEPQGSDLLAAERAKATFNPQELAVVMYGQPWLDKMNSILTILQNDPAFDKSKRYYQGRTERFASALHSNKRLFEVGREHKWDPEERQIASFLFDEAGPFGLHVGMFLPTLENQMTDEQKKKYLEPALRYEIIGCYAQTELGHGSNVQGLETTCTYHPESGEFELNSPTLTSSKWWIGGLGKAANHAIVMARLITNGKDYGPHPFIVQIRSLKDHTPLPGVTVGDIGPKLGYNTTDNGFLMFDHVRIPHFNMLAKYSKVDKKTGEYIRPPNAKLSYGTMVFIRANLVMGVRYALARATTIAIRYSAIRSQFVDAANPKKFNGKTVETPVIDYTMQQYRLFPHLAAAYACFFTGRSMMDLYHRNMKNMASGDFSLLADTHATSSGLKSLTTTMAAEAIEDCRRACGGHGYSLFSGLGSFYLDFLPNVTWEGDNYILTQQTARYLFKTFRNLASGKTNRNKETNFTISYLSTYLENPKKTCPITNGEQFLNPELILSSLGHRSAYLIAESVDLIDNKQRSWNSMLVNISRISRAHCQYVLVSNFWTALQSDERLRKNKPLYEAVRDLALLFSLNTLEKELADFLASGYITPAQAPLIKEQVIACLDRIRPNAVALVDAFSLPDYLLNSALGRYDGKVYEAMTSMAEREPLNSTLVVKGYEEHIRPLVWAGKDRCEGEGVKARL